MAAHKMFPPIQSGPTELMMQTGIEQFKRFYNPHWVNYDHQRLVECVRDIYKAMRAIEPGSATPYRE